MNAYFLVSGALAAFMLVGHATIGRKQFFLPMLGATFDPTSKRIMEFVWHMSTVALALPPVALIYAGLEGVSAASLKILIGFLAAQFAAWGVVHLALIGTSGLPGAVYKQFQWSLFLGIAATALAGLILG
jgi:hypothetical protein